MKKNFREIFVHLSVTDLENHNNTDQTVYFVLYLTYFKKNILLTAIVAAIIYFISLAFHLGH